MKWLFLVLIVVLGFFAVQLYPMVYKEKMCFDTTEPVLTNIQYNIVARGLTQQDVCYQRAMAILDLQDCLRTATASSTLAHYTNTIIESAVYIIRPLTKSLAALTNEHNNDCIDFPTYQIE